MLIFMAGLSHLERLIGGKIVDDGMLQARQRFPLLHFIHDSPMA
jgi:hypothetical protein